MDNVKPLYLFVGRASSGKETQGKLLAEKLSIPLFATGAEFRKIIASGSPLGQRIKATYDAGLLMPTWVADYMFEDFVFNLPPETGAVFEGSGRDLGQAQTIEKVCTWLGRPFVVFNLVVSPEVVVARSLARARDATDSEEAVKVRLQEYDRLTAPAIDYFHTIGVCVDIDGEQSIETIHAEIMKHIKE